MITNKHTAAALVIFAFISINSSAQQRPVLAPHILEDTEPEMLTPEYWISLQPDAFEVILTPEQIDKFNAGIRERQVVLREFHGRPDPIEPGASGFTSLLKSGCFMNLIQPLELAPTLAGDTLRKWIEHHIEWLRTENRGMEDQRKAPWTEDMKNELISSMNAGDIPAEITRRFGIVVEHTHVRYFPTMFPGYSRNSEMDLFQAASLTVGNPVTIVHQSSEGDFYYIESPIVRGWTPASAIGLARREDIRKLSESRDFIVCTGHKIPVYSDPEYKVFSRFIYMSSILSLERTGRDGYVVKLPWRKPDSSLGIARGYIRPGDDVSIGYLPYTKANVIYQMFKMNDLPYGWKDQQDKRACAGVVRVMLGCFGIHVGAHPSLVLPATDIQTRIDPSLSTEEKTAIVDGLEPVITFGGNSGHLVMLLGKARNGRIYFLHQGGFGYTDKDGQRVMVARQTVNWIEHPWYDISKPNVFTTIR